MVAIIGVSLLLGAGPAERPTAAVSPMPVTASSTTPASVAPVPFTLSAAADTLTVAAFEHSGFLSRYRPIGLRSNGQGAQALRAYLFEDAENPRGRVMVELGPRPDNVRFVTVVWHSETIAGPAAWTSMKSRFMADLVEATFPEIEFGELSSYVWEQQGHSYPEGLGAIPRARMPGAKVFAGATGASLVVGFERFPDPVASR